MDRLSTATSNPQTRRSPQAHLLQNRSSPYNPTERRLRGDDLLPARPRVQLREQHRRQLKKASTSLRIELRAAALPAIATAASTPPVRRNTSTTSARSSAATPGGFRRPSALPRPRHPTAVALPQAVAHPPAEPETDQTELILSPRTISPPSPSSPDALHPGTRTRYPNPLRQPPTRAADGADQYTSPFHPTPVNRVMRVALDYIRPRTTSRLYASPPHPTHASSPRSTHRALGIIDPKPLRQP